MESFEHEVQMMLRFEHEPFIYTSFHSLEQFTHASIGSITFYDTGRLSFDCLGRITALVQFLPNEAYLIQKIYKS